MEAHELIRNLIETLSNITKYKPYLGVIEEKENIMDGGSVTIEEEKVDKCDPLPLFSYLDSSSRLIEVRGANIYIASLYGNLEGKHVTIPAQVEFPFIAIKASKDVVNEIKNSSLSNLVRTENVNGVPYDASYKDDNILDELRISLENYFINKAGITIVDGPIYPGPYLPIVGEPYSSAFERLIKERKRDNLIGIVKRLNFSRKISRVLNIDATDDVVIMELGKGNQIYISPIFREDYPLSDTKLERFMVYVKVRDSVFRVESANKDLLCSGVWTALRDVSARGIPTFIETADKMARKLSAAAYIFAFSYAKSLIGVTYEDWNRLYLANVDLEQV
ncbi:MAG: DNA double-strand break repair nuclease NurA [Sulfolobaceae archaeon]